MVAVRRLTHPPIAEAVLGLYVRRSEPIKDSTPSRLPAEFKAMFPKLQKMQQGHFQVSFAASADGATPPPQAQHDIRFGGYRFEAEDGSKVALFAHDRFLFSHVSGYDTWEHFIADAKFAWESLVPLGAAIEVERIGIRYINKCKLSLPADPKRLLAAGPNLPSELTQDIVGWLSQVSLDLPEIAAVGTVVQTLQTEADGTSYVIVDVDITKPGLSVSPNSPELWEQVETFRQWKNRIFFAHVTEELLEPYK